MKHVHYGWVVCITCTLLLFITMGTVSNGFSVYLPYIMDERSLTHAQTSSLVTLRCLTAFLAAQHRPHHQHGCQHNGEKSLLSAPPVSPSSIPQPLWAR